MRCATMLLLSTAEAARQTCPQAAVSGARIEELRRRTEAADVASMIQKS
jgi:hypothetical protein